MRPFDSAGQIFVVIRSKYDGFHSSSARPCSTTQPCHLPGQREHRRGNPSRLLAPHGASRRRTHVGAKYSHCNGCGTFVREPLGGQWPACAMAPEGSPRAFTTLAMTCADAQVRRTCGRGRNFPWASINAMTLPAMSTLANAAQSGCRSAAAAGAVQRRQAVALGVAGAGPGGTDGAGAGAVPAAAAARGA